MGESVFGVVAGFAASGGQLASDDLHFVQAIANVLAGAIARQRAGRRLFLEREIGILISRAEDVPEVAAGVERALMGSVGATNVTIWVRSGASDGFERVWPPNAGEQAPADAEQHPSPAWELGFEPGPSPRCQPVERSNRYRLEFPISNGDARVGVVSSDCEEPIAADDELLLGLERVGTTLGDFLHWNRVDAALRESEHRYREQTAELETIYATLLA